MTKHSTLNYEQLIGINLELHVDLGGKVDVGLDSPGPHIGHYHEHGVRSAVPNVTNSIAFID